MLSATSLFSVAAADSLPATGALTPVIGHIQQKRPTWCWAACVEMVLKAADIEKPQCEIARHPKKPKVSCCSLETFPCGTMPASFMANGTCDRVLGSARISALWQDHGVQAQIVKNPLPLGRLLEELNEGRPVQVWLQPSKGTQHVVLVAAANDAGDLLVADPCDTQLRSATYEGLRFSDYRGKWLFSWTNLGVSDGLID